MGKTITLPNSCNLLCWESDFILQWLSFFKFCFRIQRERAIYSRLFFKKKNRVKIVAEEIICQIKTEIGNIPETERR